MFTTHVGIKDQIDLKHKHRNTRESLLSSRMTIRNRQKFSVFMPANQVAISLTYQTHKNKSIQPCINLKPNRPHYYFHHKHIHARSHTEYELPLVR